MRITSFLLLCVFWVSVGATSGQVPLFEPVGTISELMVDIIYPTSDRIFYVERDPPTNDYEWSLLGRSALTLTESGNLLMMEGRAINQDEWMKDAKLLVEAGVAALEAVRAQDLAAIVAVNDQLLNACVTCHQNYHPRYRNRRNRQ